MSAVLVLETPRFLRKTTLRPAEANTNFKMLDNDVGEAVTSAEADQVTPLMSKIYTRLLLTPNSLREGERVLRFTGEERAGKWVTAWEQLRTHLRVSGETANKALRWMHAQGIIGYYAGKNGVGIRIFLNRASASVAARRSSGFQKNLAAAPASSGGARTSPDEVPFKDSFADPESLDFNFKYPAPKNGARASRTNSISAEKSEPATTPVAQLTPNRVCGTPPSGVSSSGEVTLEAIVLRLRSELEPAVRRAAGLAAAVEHERTREWLENRGLPKAARVAQHETYNTLRKCGMISESARVTRAHADVGRGDYTPPEPHPLTYDEVADLAGACVAILETRGQSIELTLAEMGTGAGGFLLPKDAGRVRDEAYSLLTAGGSREGK